MGLACGRRVLCPRAQARRGRSSIVGGASVVADSLGRHDEAVALARRAAALDPLSYIAHGNLALRCLNSTLFDEAAAALDTAFRLNPRAGLLRCAARSASSRAGLPRRSPRSSRNRSSRAETGGNRHVASRARQARFERSGVGNADRAVLAGRRASNRRGFRLHRRCRSRVPSGSIGRSSSGTPGCRRCSPGRF